MTLKDLDLTTLDLSPTSIAAVFQTFMDEFGRTYKDEEEKKERLAIFTKNVEKCAEHNKTPGQTFTMGINQFSDLTEDEFKKQALGFRG